MISRPLTGGATNVVNSSPARRRCSTRADAADDEPAPSPTPAASPIPVAALALVAPRQEERAQLRSS